MKTFVIAGKIVGMLIIIMNPAHVPTVWTGGKMFVIVVKMWLTAEKTYVTDAKISGIVVKTFGTDKHALPEPNNRLIIT